MLMCLWEITSELKALNLSVIIQWPKCAVQTQWEDWSIEILLLEEIFPASLSSWSWWMMTALQWSHYCTSYTTSMVHILRSLPVSHQFWILLLFLEGAINPDTFPYSKVVSSCALCKPFSVTPWHHSLSPAHVQVVDIVVGLWSQAQHQGKFVSVLLVFGHQDCKLCYKCIVIRTIDL